MELKSKVEMLNGAENEEQKQQEILGIENSPLLNERRLSIEDRLKDVIQTRSPKDGQNAVPATNNPDSGSLSPVKPTNSPVHSEKSRESSSSPEKVKESLEKIGMLKTLSLQNEDARSPELDIVIKTPNNEVYPIADSKRDDDFHALFPGITIDERLVEDYTCAWLNDIPVHGRMYISQRHINFNAKVIWTYAVSIPFEDIKLIEKKSVAGIVANSIEISTAEKKYFFTSFLSRNQCFNQLQNLVKGYPKNIIETVVPVTTEAAPLVMDSRIKGRSISLGTAELFQKSGSALHTASSIVLDEDKAKGLAEIANETEINRASSPEAESNASISSHIIRKKIDIKAPSVSDLNHMQQRRPRVSEYAPFECDHIELHKKFKKVLDVVFPLTLPQCFAFIYGNNSEFALKLWKSMKYREIKTTNWLSNDTNISQNHYVEKNSPNQIFEEGYKRRLEYIIPVFNPLGPKESKCIINETICSFADKQICLKSITETPDVPSGDAFKSHLRVCLLFQSPRSTRMIVSCNVEWLKFSLLKMAIESAVPEGVKEYQNIMSKQLLEYATELGHLLDPQESINSENAEPLAKRTSIVHSLQELAGAAAHKCIALDKLSLLTLLTTVSIALNLVSFCLIMNINRKLNMADLSQFTSGQRTEL